MDTVRALLVDAFTDEPLSGNAAGVVPAADGLGTDRMQAIAHELGASETAFVTASDRADRRVRYFTPTQEVDLCGHATVAAHAHLYADGAIAAGEHTFETEAGVLDVEVTEAGVVWMTQNPPEVREVDLAYDRLADALGVDPAALAAIGEDLPVAVATTGLPFLVVPATYLQAVGDADPDYDAVERVCEEVEATGLYLFTFDALAADATLHGRAFVPLAGIDEDPVTGTASGAVGAYLREFEAFDDELPDEMVFEQGHYVDRPGRVRVRVGETVQVGGRATTALDGRLSVPPGEDDEIVEA